MQRNPLWAYSPQKFTRFKAQVGNRSSKKIAWGKIFLITGATMILLSIFGFFLYLQLRVLKNLPDVSKIKDMQLTQATVITDRNGIELYKIFDENREYVDISQIHQNMLDAIVAVEDKSFWEHEGLDPIGIFRAGVYTMLWQNRGWGSTLTQQLITNLMKLERPFWGSFLEKVDYKLTQIVLAKRLNNVLQQQIQAEHKNLSSAEVKHEMKKKILELYLNYVFLWNNAYGVEAASKTYFNKSAKDLSIMESAILAAIPKAPSRYDPYKSGLLMGTFKITDPQGKAMPYEGNIKSQIVTKFRENIQAANFANKKTADTFVKFANSLAPSSISVDGTTYTISYTNGRAEFVVGRMYEDGKISEEQAKSAFLESLTKTFEKSSFAIKAPHFVFRIKELLEQDYGSWSTKQWGIIVKTSLDYTIQQIAESAIKSNSSSLFEYGASNASLLYSDSSNGDILAYVGSLDYFNKDIQGQNDMVKNPRQSWSSIKPLIYALGFDKLPLTIDTPIYDIPFKAGKDTPNNADGKFDGLLPLKKALGYSRNIPAVKMFFALGGEEVAKPFLQKLGLKGIKNEIEYGYPLSLGAGEVSMLELAGAYTHLSTQNPAELNPILEIKANDGSIIYQKQVKNQDNIIKPGIIYAMWKILSDPSNRIGVWASKFNIKWLTYALKTGTSNVKTDKGSRPRDGWLAAYTPSKVILMRAGNADARPMNSKAYWGSIHADSIKRFLNELLSKGLITNEEMTNKDTSTLTISSISGKLAADTTPSALVVKTMGQNANLPKDTEWPIVEIEIDTSCFGKVSPLSLPEHIKKGYLIQPTTFMPNKMDLEDIKKYLIEQAQTWSNEGLKLFMEEPTNYCEDKQPIINDAITITFITPQDKQSFAKKNRIIYSISSPSNIKKVNITLDGKTLHSYIDNSTEIFWAKELDLSAYPDGPHTLGILAIDSNNMTKASSLGINLISEDQTAPFLKKEQSSVQKLDNWSYQVSLFFDDEHSGVKEGKIFEKGKNKALLDFKLQTAQFTTSSAELIIETKDFYNNILSQELDLENW